MPRAAFLLTESIVDIPPLACRRGFLLWALAAAATTVLVGATASAQVAGAVPYPYGLDPFKPSDAEWLRRHGSVLVTQTPLVDLQRLDPFKPSDAALLRDLGGGMPLWGLWYPPAAIPPPLLFSPPRAADEHSHITIFVGQLPPGSVAAPSPQPLPGGLLTALRPDTNDGMWISYDGRRWISAGPAVRFEEAAFTRTGEHDGFPVFRRKDAGDDIIYLPTRQNLLAPYRLKGK